MIRFEVDNHSVKVITSMIARAKMLLRGGSAAMMKEIGELMERQHTKRIVNQEIGWKPNIRGTTPLFQTGALAHGFQSRSSMFTVTLGPPNLPYSYIQQAGGTMTGNPYMAFMANGRLVMAKKAKVPARPYMGITPQNWVEITQVFDRHMSRIFSWL
jgi:phage gpG-like protein